MHSPARAPVPALVPEPGPVLGANEEESDLGASSWYFPDMEGVTGTTAGENGPRRSPGPAPAGSDRGQGAGGIGWESKGPGAPLPLEQGEHECGGSPRDVLPCAGALWKELSPLRLMLNPVLGGPPSSESQWGLRGPGACSLLQCRF